MREDTTPESSLTLFATRLTGRQNATLPYLFEPGDAFLLSRHIRSQEY